MKKLISFLKKVFYIASTIEDIIARVEKIEKATERIINLPEGQEINSDAKAIIEDLRKFKNL